METPDQPHDPDTPRVALIVPENRRNYNVDSDILAEVVLKIRRAGGDVVPSGRRGISDYLAGRELGAPPSIGCD